jgi:raffinose/stachyose/melibiose transport system substrate-binding protein
MTNHRGIRTFPVVLLSVLMAAACASAAEKTLRLMHIQMAATGRAVEQAVKRFEAVTGAKVEIEALKNASFKTKIATTLPSDEPPDVLHTWGGGGLVQFVRRGWIAPIPTALSTVGINEQILEFCTVDGELYAVPTDVSLVAFWYRKDIFRLHDLQVPKTLKQLGTVVLRLRQLQETPISLGNKAHWPGAFYFDYLVTRAGGAAEYIDQSNRAGRPAPTPEAMQAETAIQRLLAVQPFNEGYNGIGYDESRTLLLDGKVAMTLMGSWLLSYAIDKHPEVVPELGVFPFPALKKGGSSDVLLGGTNAAYAISSKCKEPALAAKLVEFLTNEAAAADWVKAGRFPARNVDAKNDAKVLEEMRALLDNAPRIQNYFDVALLPAVAEQHKPHTQAILAGKPMGLSGRILVGLGGLVGLVFLAFALREAYRSGKQKRPDVSG